MYIEHDPFGTTPGDFLGGHSLTMLLLVGFLLSYCGVAL